MHERDQWRTSSYSGNVNQNCVEVSVSSNVTKVRDTQHRDHGHLSVPASEWRAFLAELRRGTL